MAKKLSVLKPGILRNLYCFLLFSYHNLYDTVTNIVKDMFLDYKQNFKCSVFCDFQG